MIDAGGVEFQMELTAKLDEATKMLREMTKVEAEAAKLDSALRKAGKATSVLEDLTGKAGGSFKAVGSTMLEHLTALATFEGLKDLGEGFIELGKEALLAAGEAERTRRSYQLLLGDEPANELLGFLDRLAGKTEFTDGVLKQFAGSYIKAGISGEALNRAMAATIDLAAMTQNKMEGAAGAIGLISKIQLKGGISERELVGAGIGGQAFFKRVSEETGIGIKDVEKKIAEGKVKAGILIEALYSEIAAKTGKPLGGAGVAMSQTYLAQLEKTKDIIPNLFEELEATGGLEPLTKGLDRLVQGLSPDSVAGGKIVHGLSVMLDGFGKLVAGIDFEAWSNRAVSAMEIISGIAWFTAGALGDLGKVFDGLTRLGESLGETLYETTALVEDFFKGAMKLGEAVWQGLQDGIVSGITYVVNAVAGLGTAVADRLKSVLGIHSPSTVGMDVGRNLDAGVEVGVNRGMPQVEDTIGEAFGPRLLPGLTPPFQLTAPAQPSLAYGGPSPAADVVSPRAGDRTFEANITINIGAPAGTAGEAQDQAEEAGRSVQRALESLFERWAAEGGAA
jgi:hypothetical protein